MPHEIQFDSAGHLYIAERDNHVVRKSGRGDRASSPLSPARGRPGFSGDGGPASSAQLRQPHSIAVDPAQRFLLICDIGNHRIRRVELATGIIETFAGTGEKGSTPDGAPLKGTPLNGPRTMAFDSAGRAVPCAARGQRDLSRGSATPDLHHVAGTGEQGYSGDGGQARLARLGGPKGPGVVARLCCTWLTPKTTSIREIDAQPRASFERCWAPVSGAMDRSPIPVDVRSLDRMACWSMREAFYM